MSKQTSAVQWLVDQLEKYEDYAKISYRCLGEIEIALEMEKQQIMDAWIGTDNELQRLAAEKYYQETFVSKGSGAVGNKGGAVELPKQDVDKLGNENVPKLGYDVEKLAEDTYKWLNNGYMDRKSLPTRQELKDWFTTMIKLESMSVLSEVSNIHVYIENGVIHVKPNTSQQNNLKKINYENKSRSSIKH